jgi:hypothetical protein
VTDRGEGHRRSRRTPSPKGHASHPFLSPRRYSSLPVVDLERGTVAVPAVLPPCEHLFVSIKGSSYARFRRALDTGNLTLVRATAAELATVNLDDALRICLLMRADPSRYERAVVRWLGRLCLERPDTTLTELKLAVAAFERLPGEPGEAVAELRRFVWH